MAEQNHQELALQTDFTLQLPNGLRFHGTDRRQRAAARFLVNEIFHRCFYQRPGFEIKAGDTVIDAGANMGLFALWAAPLVGHGRMLCIEPAPSMDTLIYNLHCNDITSVIPIRCALASTAGELEFVTYPDFNITNHKAGFRPSGWGKFSVTYLQGHRAAKAQRFCSDCRTLESILDEHSLDVVDLLKIDCEGAEYDILESASNETLARIRRLCLEFHEFHPSHDHRRLQAKLRAAGFHVSMQRSFVGTWLLKTGSIWAHRTL